MLRRVVNNIFCYNLDNRDMLREVTVKIGLNRIDTQEGVTVEILLNSKTIELVMSSEFSRKQEFKLKKVEKSIYVRYVDGSFNKKSVRVENSRLDFSNFFFFFFHFYFILFSLIRN